MRDKKEFYQILSAINGAAATEYSRLVGDFDFSRYVLKINSLDQVEQGGNLLVVRVPQILAGFPPHLFNTPVRRTALEDFLTRRLVAEIDRLSRYDAKGISRRRLTIAVPGQKILPRTSLLAAEEYLEARITVHLPLAGGLVDSVGAQEIFFEDLSDVVNRSLIYCNLDDAELEEFVDLMEDVDQIRQILPTRGLVAFLAEGSLLSRLGNTDYPGHDELRPLFVDESLSMEMDTPNGGTVRGVGIPQGITLILGDAYSGRSDILSGIAHGIYNHIPGDGRERCVTVPDAVQVAAEVGRSIQRVDLSFFLGALPGEENTSLYSRIDADPSAAQAAQVIESLEVGARVLLFDESSSSSAFLTRDARLDPVMPITEQHIQPLSVRARQLVDDLGVSLVVAGSSSVAEFISVADQIYRVEGGKLEDITEACKAIEIQSQDVPAYQDVARLVERSRWVVPSSLDPSSGKEDQHVEALARDLLEFGRSTIDLQGVKQLADIYQTETIGRILYYAKIHYLDERRPIRELLDLVDRDLSTEGLECLSRDLRGDFARPRRYEIAAALNRLDTLRISHSAE